MDLKGKKDSIVLIKSRKNKRILETQKEGHFYIFIGHK